MFGLLALVARCIGILTLLAQGTPIALAAETISKFATFTTREVDIDIEDGEIEVDGSFTLGPGSNGLDVSKQPVSFQAKGGTADYSVIIPAGSFKMAQGGEFKFLGTINGVKIVAAIRQTRAGAFEFEIVTERANLRGFANPVTVSLGVGNHGGSRTVRAKIE